MRFAAFTTVAASAGGATNPADMLDNLRQQTGGPHLQNPHWADGKYRSLVASDTAG